MGSFYTNIVIKTNDYNLKFIKQYISSGFVFYRESYLYICSDVIEQNLEKTTEILSKLTENASNIGYAFMNHDDGLLIMKVAKSGNLLFSYCSSPEYFSGNDDVPEVSGLINIISVFDVRNISEFEKILYSSEYTFEMTRHEKICETLNIPKFTIGYACKYIEDGEYPVGVNCYEIQTI